MNHLVALPLGQLLLLLVYAAVLGFVSIPAYLFIRGYIQFLRSDQGGRGMTIASITVASCLLFVAVFLAWFVYMGLGRLLS